MKCVGDGRRNRGSAEGGSQLSSLMPTQVFDLSDHVRPQSQADVAATQTLDVATNSRCSNNSQTDFLATQVFDAAPTMHGNSGDSNSRAANSQTEPSTQVFDVAAGNSGGSPLLNSRSANFQTEPCTQVFDVAAGNSSGSPLLNSRAANFQTEPATQVFDAMPMMQRKSDGSDSQTDLLQTQVFCEPAAVAAAQRRSGSSLQESTQTFSAPVQPRRSSAVGKDGSRMSFSPESCSTQVFPAGETDFPHLTLEMSECTDSHNDSCTTVTPTDARISLQQVDYLGLSSSLNTSIWIARLCQ